MLKGQKGITLVALVITIIVMLILAGVSISLVVGQNGVLTQAEGAASASALASIKEKVELSVAETELAYLNEKATTDGFATSKSDYFTAVSARRPDGPEITDLEIAIEENGVKVESADVTDAVDSTPGKIEFGVNFDGATANVEVVITGDAIDISYP